MGFAAFGWLPRPRARCGGHDSAVILNALRALRGDHTGPPPLSRDAEAGAAVLRRARPMRDDLPVLRDTAHQVAAGDLDAALVSFGHDAFLQDTLLPHGTPEDSALYPELACPWAARRPPRR
ncbi:MAG: hypothetical protein H6522_04320 [Mycolicibacterium sp.]|nr:hypothetical protein [Mycolicibacterium sp.]